MTLAPPVPASSQAKLGMIVKARPKLRGCKDERTEKERGEEEEKKGEEEGGGGDEEEEGEGSGRES